MEDLEEQEKMEENKLMEREEERMMLGKELEEGGKEVEMGKYGENREDVKKL